MAFSAVPSTHIANWSEDGTNITVPIASFPELTAAEADGSTGDIRKIILAFADKFYSLYNAMATADRPAKMQAYRSTAVNDAAGTSTRTYTFTFTVDGSYEVAAEA
jgi:hypothetical protein